MRGMLKVSDEFVRKDREKLAPTGVARKVLKMRCVENERYIYYL